MTAVSCPHEHPHSFAPSEELAQRQADRDDLWDFWNEGELRADVVERYEVDSVVVDRRVGDLVVDEDFASAGNGEEGGEALTLVPRFENEYFVVHSLIREDGTTT